MLQPSRDAETRINASFQNAGENISVLPEISEADKRAFELMFMIAELATSAFLSSEDKELLEHLDNESYLNQMMEHLENRCTADPETVAGLKVWVSIQLDDCSREDGTVKTDTSILQELVSVHSHETHIVRDPFSLLGEA